MAKKQFDTKGATSKFFTDAEPIKEELADSTQNTDNTHYTQNKQSTEGTQKPYRTQGRPRKTPEERKRGYRYNLLLDADLNQYLHEIIWTKKTTMTQYVNDLIRADYEAYLKDCKEKGKDPFEGWETDNV